MARKLYVTDEMGLDDALTDIAEASLKCALMWPWIIPYFDDWGRGEANARRIKGKIFPNFGAVSTGDVEGMLTEFAAAGLIEIYEVGGKRYMAVEREKWFRFQTHIHASKRQTNGSRFPAPPGDAIAQAQNVSREIAAESGPPREIAPTDEALHEIAETREEARVSATFRASPSPSPSPSLHLHYEDPPNPPGGTVPAGQGGEVAARAVTDKEPGETKEPERTRNTLLLRFDTFYAAYPKKRSRDAAEKAWVKLRPNADALAAMLEALTWQIRSPDWTKDGGSFVPNPATYLNSGGWKDEPDTTVSAVRASPPARAAPVTSAAGQVDLLARQFEQARGR